MCNGTILVGIFEKINTYGKWDLRYVAATFRDDDIERLKNDPHYKLVSIKRTWQMAVREANRLNLEIANINC